MELVVQMEEVGGQPRSFAALQLAQPNAEDIIQRKTHRSDVVP